MLTIKNIDKVKYMMCYGRDIYHISNQTNAMGEQSYVFEFDAIGDAKDYNKPQEVHLVRNADNDGNYRLFVMGLQLISEIKVNQYTIKDKQQLVLKISNCLAKVEQYWKNLK
jgi:hypothetical protein